MLKWYEEQGENKDVVISSRIRLARNLIKYPFAKKISENQAVQLVEEVRSCFDIEEKKENYMSCNLSELSETEKLAMVERHILSPVMTNKKQATGLVMENNESVSVMINEEDHLKIQALVGGMNIKEAYKKADELDDYLYDKLGFAYQEHYGYLTSCPTNTGTGLRASYMVFLPALTGANKINRLAEEAMKYGVSIRGIYGEGSRSVSNIYQISNQKTLGSSELDIIHNLDNIVAQMIRQERKRREYLLVNNYDEIEDQVYRSYGVLKYTKQMNSIDALTLLSQVKFGMDMKILTLEQSISIYEMMMAIQPHSLQCHHGKYVGSKVRDKIRAEYLNEKLPKLVKAKE